MEVLDGIGGTPSPGFDSVGLGIGGTGKEGVKLGGTLRALGSGRNAGPPA